MAMAMEFSEGESHWGLDKLNKADFAQGLEEREEAGVGGMSCT